uniref:hypothetical protein n=1 Tax=Flavobacterium sp. TaxID=239 RepID=UPI00404A176F
MKNKPFLFLSLLALALSSCSTSDDDATTDSETIFLPLTASDYWVYNVISDQLTNVDSIYIASEQTINDATFSQFGTRDPFYGFYASAVKNNLVRKNGNQLLLTGSLNSSALGEFFDLEIGLEDFIFMSEDAPLNQQLDLETGVVSQDFDSLPLDITYTLKSNAGDSYESYLAPNGQTYDNVKAVKITLRLYVSTTFTSDTLPIPITIAVLEAQDVVVSTLYFAEGVGVVHTSTDYQYELNPSLLNNPLIPIDDIGVPTEASFSVIENLTSYNVN